MSHAEQSAGTPVGALSSGQRTCAEGSGFRAYNQVLMQQVPLYVENIRRRCSPGATYTRLGLGLIAISPDKKRSPPGAYAAGAGSNVSPPPPLQPEGTFKALRAHT